MSLFCASSPLPILRERLGEGSFWSREAALLSLCHGVERLGEVGFLVRLRIPSPSVSAQGKRKPDSASGSPPNSDYATAWLHIVDSTVPVARYPSQSWGNRILDGRSLGIEGWGDPHRRCVWAVPGRPLQSGHASLIQAAKNALTNLVPWQR